MRYLLLCSALLLGACSWGAQPEPRPAPTLSPLMAFMAGHDKGETTTLDDPEFGQGVQVIMQDAFTSATGDTCRRASLINAASQTEVVVMCRKGEGDAATWQMMPRIWGQGLE